MGAVGGGRTLEGAGEEGFRVMWQSSGRILVGVGGGRTLVRAGGEKTLVGVGGPPKVDRVYGLWGSPAVT